MTLSIESNLLKGRAFLMNALLKRKGTGAGNNGNVSKGKEASKGSSPSVAQEQIRDAAILYAVPSQVQVQPEAGH